MGETSGADLTRLTEQNGGTPNHLHTNALKSLPAASSWIRVLETAPLEPSRYLVVDRCSFRPLRCSVSAFSSWVHGCHK